MIHELTLPAEGLLPVKTRQDPAGTLGISFWAAAARIEPAGSTSRLRHGVKFLLRSWCQPRLTRAWLARLVQPDLAPLWVLRPRLASKLQRPYVSSEWNLPVRCAALLGHYEALPRLFSPTALAGIYATGVDVLDLVNTRSSRRLKLRLKYHDQFEKEGELTLSVVDVATGLNIAGLTFCLARNDGRLIAVIGGLQAHPDPRTRGLIHDVAKEMCGLRPKALALWCLQQFAALWQVEQIQAVCDQQHIYRHSRKQREIAASYDGFWSESDGRRLPGGGWELPLQMRQRTRAEVKSTRRKIYEQRYALLNTLSPQLIAAAGRLARDYPAQDHTTPSTPVFEFPPRDSTPALALGGASGPVPFASGLGQPNHSF